MNKTAIINYELMKRRYSVPEIIMRRHKLQESSSINRKEIMQKSKENTEKKTNPHKNRKDESCQTENTFESVNSLKSQKSLRKTVKIRRRNSLKNSSYYQHKSINMSPKKFLHNKLRRTPTLDNVSTCKNEDRDKNFESNNIQFYNDKIIQVFNGKTISIKNKRKYLPLNQDRVTFLSSPASVTDIQPVTQLYSNTRDKILKNENHLPYLQLNEKSNEFGNNMVKMKVPVINNKTNGKYFENSRSLDQTTSGYNTISGSSDNTPRKKSPDPLKVIGSNDTTNYVQNSNFPQSENQIFPVSFQSESVFIHPYKNGFLTHKEFHHVSVSLEPNLNMEEKLNETSELAKNDYFKTEIKVEVNDSKTDEEEIGKNNEPNKHNYSALENDFKKDTAEHTPKSVSMHQGKSEKNNYLNLTDYKTDEDNNFLLPNIKQKPENQKYFTCPKLKIQLGIENIELNDNYLKTILLQQSKDSNNKDITNSMYSEKINNQNSKIALNYLFKKLGNSYPKRCLLQHTNNYNENFNILPTKYYSELPKIGGSELPTKVLFNNQTYDILSNNLLPTEKSNIKINNSAAIEKKIVVQSKTSKTDLNAEQLSDSDISIPDSLEDFQQVKLKHNKYEKYDDKLARGEVYNIQPKSKPTNKFKNSISYFISLSDTNSNSNKNKTQIIMPIELKEKLYIKNKNLSKHGLCLQKLPKARSKPRKMIHKQIQTNLMNDNSIIKSKSKKSYNVEYKEKSELKDKPANTESLDSDLDNKIMQVLLSGLQQQNNQMSILENKEISHEKYITQPRQTGLTSIENQVSMPYKQNLSNANSKSNHNDLNYNTNNFSYNHSISSPERKFNAKNVSSEILLSKNENKKFNDADSYRFFKKSRKIYYPTKLKNNKNKQPNSLDCSLNHDFVEECKTNLSCMKYRRKYADIKDQQKRQTLDKHSNCQNWINIQNNNLNENSSTSLTTSKFLKVNSRKERHHSKLKNNFSRNPQGTKARRFYQKFEAIPEELSDSSTDSSDQNQEDTEQENKQENSDVYLQDIIQNSQSSENELTTKTQHFISEKEEVTENPENQIDTIKDLNENFRSNSEIDDNLNYTEKKGNFEPLIEYKNNFISDDYKNKHLFSVKPISEQEEQEELITLSKGWINFYLLKESNTEDSSATEDNNDENSIMTGTVSIPQQYTVHVQAKPITNIIDHKSPTVLPNLLKSSKKCIRSIENINNNKNKRTAKNCILKDYRLKNQLPKLNLSSDESDHFSSNGTGASNESKIKPVGFTYLNDVIQIENSLSATSSNNSEELIENISRLKNTCYNKKLPRDDRYCKKYLSKQNGKTVILKSQEKNCKNTPHFLKPNVEMELGLRIKKNFKNCEVIPNNSWKLTIKSEESRCINNEIQNNNNYADLIPSSLSLCCKVTSTQWKINTNDTELTFSDNTNDTPSSSVLSNSETIIEKKSSSDNNCNSSTERLHNQSFDDDLTVIGSAINPLFKPRVLTMSERDVTRMILPHKTCIENIYCK